MVRTELSVVFWLIARNAISYISKDFFGLMRQKRINNLSIFRKGGRLAGNYSKEC